MHDPKFEQEVQRRMHDLEFVPSETVWAGIQQGIAPRERRRAVAILWWLFPGMLLLAGGMVIYRHSASTNRVAVVVPARGRSADAGRGVSGGPGGSRQTAGGTGDGVERSGAGSAAGGNGNVVDEKSAGGKVGGNGRVAEGSGTGNGKKTEVEAATGPEEEGAAMGKRAAVSRFHPGLIGGLASRMGIQAPRLNLQPVNPAVSGIRQPRHPWTAGFAVGGGGSSIHSATGNGLVSLSSANAYTYANVPQPPRVSSSNVAPGGSKQNKTDVKVDYSYWAGIYGEKQLSARWSLDIGLNLRYYSVRFQTENQVNAYAPTSASLFAPSSVTYTLNSSSAYSSSSPQTYINSYYFLEVPVTVQWKLNQSRSLPLFWRGGAVLSYLMSSNGLYYDNASGTYKGDNGVVRRIQAGVNSGLMVGIPVRGVQIQAGPEVQYALSSMLTTGSGGGHMVYGGMRVSLMR